MIPRLRIKLILLLLVGIIIIESTILAQPYFPKPTVTYTKGRPQSVSFPFTLFNQPISNNTEQELNPAYSRSWEINIQSSLISSTDRGDEAELAFAPSYPSESGSLPTLIVQERGDGLLRIEYFAQAWANTYGLVLYNSTAPNWTGGGANVALRFEAFGPPSAVNPQLAPRPNGNVTISVGGSVALTDYPIAWANLSDVYVYGIRGSSFMAGAIQISIYELSLS